MSNTNEMNLIHGNNNWYFNYFKDINNLPFTFYNTIINFKIRKNINSNNIKDCHIKSDNYIYYFNYKTFKF